MWRLALLGMSPWRPLTTRWAAKVLRSPLSGHKRAMSPVWVRSFDALKSWWCSVFEYGFVQLPCRICDAPMLYSLRPSYLDHISRRKALVSLLTGGICSCRFWIVTLALPQPVTTTYGAPGPIRVPCMRALPLTSTLQQAYTAEIEVRYLRPVAFNSSLPYCPLNPTYRAWVWLRARSQPRDCTGNWVQIGNHGGT